MLAAFENLESPWLLVVAHARIGELCLQLDWGDEAQRHLRATLPMLAELGARSTEARARWAVAMAWSCAPIR